MVIKLSKSNDDFIKTYKKYLEDDEIKLQLFLTNLQSDYDKEIGIRGGVYNGNNLVALFLNAYPHMFLIHSLIDDYEAIKYLANYILENNILVSGFLAPKSISKYLLSNKNIKSSTDMEIMIINNYEFSNYLGKITLATINDFDFLLQAVKNFYDEDNISIDNEKLNNIVSSMIESKDTYIYYNSNNIKTSIGQIAKRTKNSVTLKSIYTFNEYRNHGYAKEMLKHLIKVAHKENQRLSLFVKSKNEFAKRLYKSVGFETLISLTEIRF